MDAAGCGRDIDYRVCFIDYAETAQTGASKIEATIKGIETIRQKIELSATKVKEMGHRSNQIGMIVDTINKIMRNWSKNPERSILSSPARMCRRG